MVRAEYRPIPVWIAGPGGIQLQLRVSQRSLEVLRACAAGEVAQVNGSPMHADVRVTFSVRALADRRLIKRVKNKWVPTADGEAVLREVDR